MGKSFFITGTGTDIGKTIATSVLFLSLQGMGKSVTIFKPFQTGLLEETNTYPDISWYEQQLGVRNAGFYTLEPETSPHLAAKLTNRKIDIPPVMGRIAELEQEYDIVLVEGAGGLAVPLYEQKDGFYMTKDFIRDGKLPVIFISTSGLGSIHYVVTAFSYAQTHQIEIKTILYNHYRENDRIHQDNLSTIEKLTGLTELVRIPTLNDAKTELKGYVSELLNDPEYTQKLKEVFL